MGTIFYDNNQYGSGSQYELPIASASELGGVKVGNGLSIDSSTGVLSANATPYTLPTASASTLGGVKVGSGLDINDGVLSTLSYPALSSFTTGGSMTYGSTGIGRIYYSEILPKYKNIIFLFKRSIYSGSYDSYWTYFDIKLFPINLLSALAAYESVGNTPLVISSCPSEVPNGNGYDVDSLARVYIRFKIFKKSAQDDYYSIYPELINLTTNSLPSTYRFSIMYSFI